MRARGLLIALASLGGGCELNTAAIPGTPIDAGGGRDAEAPRDAAVAPDAGFDAAAEPDAALDAGVDAALPPVRMPTFGDADLVPGINTNDDEHGPAVSPDGLFLVFERDDPEAPGRDLWVASRSGADESFGGDREIAEINGDADDSNPAWFENAAGLWLYYTSNDHPDGREDPDIRIAAFDADEITFTFWGDLTSIDTEEGESHPSLSADGEVLLFERAVFGLGTEIYEANGRALDEFVPPAASIAELSNEAEDYDAVISADGRVALFVSRRKPSAMGDVWVALRQHRDDPFEPPVLLPSGADAVNTDSDERDPYLTPEGDLYFSSNRLGDYDLFFSEGTW